MCGYSTGILNHLDDIRVTELRSDPHSRRIDWLRVLTRADPASLERLSTPLLEGHCFEVLRAPEIGLVMVRARIGNSGDRFNVGEATVTRCAVRHRAADGSLTAGIGYLLGRDEDRADRIARLDALLQRTDLRDRLLHDVVEPLRAQRVEHDRAQRARTEATRVRFFTLQPEAAT